MINLRQYHLANEPPMPQSTRRTIVPVQSMSFDVLNNGILKEISNAFFPPDSPANFGRTNLALNPLFHDEDLVPKRSNDNGSG